MQSVAIPAHFDGKHIVLDEPYELPPNASLLVTVLPIADEEASGEEGWLKAAASSDAFDFLADPAEDIYTLNDGTPVPPPT
jgi:hypothetical protein